MITIKIENSEEFYPGNVSERRKEIEFYSEKKA